MFLDEGLTSLSFLLCFFSVALGDKGRAADKCPYDDSYHHEVDLSQKHGMSPNLSHMLALEVYCRIYYANL